MKHSFEKFCKDYENIENYEKAKADNFKGWECHHRLETHTSDGERRLVDITQKELIALNMYYHRPAEELIFLTRSEHDAFRKGKPKTEEHKKKIGEGNKGKKHSEETKKKMSEAKKNMSEETKKKLSEAKKGEKNPMYGKKHSEETKKKLSAASVGKHWYNNSKIEIMVKECPDGFVPGRLLIYKETNI